jgi:hypothetical protein
VIRRLAYLLLAFLIGIGAGYLWGDSAGETQCQADKVGAQEVAIERHDKAAEVGHQVEVKTIQSETKQAEHTQRLVTEGRAHVKENPSPPDCRLDADGMRRWRSANRGASTDTTGTPDDVTAGETSGADQQSPGRPDGEPRYLGGPVSPGQGTAEGAGGVDREDRQGTPG